MIDKLFSLLQKPALWQRSSEPFWDDVHISKQMLEAHLNPDWEAASRKHSDIDRSVKWLSNVIPAGSKILDMGCGPGLYTKRLSAMGYDVTGIDYSKRSIAYARNKDTQTRYIYQNYLDLNDSETYDAIALIYCDYGALTLPERQVLLAKVYRALRPGGQFIFDVFTEKTQKEDQDKTSWSFFRNGGFWNVEPYVCLEAVYHFKNNTVAAGQTVVITDNGLHGFLIWNSVFSKQTLTDEVLPFGFQTSSVFDDMCGSPYTGEASTLCVILKKQED